ncbi:MAG TPA: VOC family protein [Bacteroidales bacterium]|nr:VOC family protein [Bacteroidales bacterium]
MLRHIGIHIHDKNEVTDFYREILGFQELNRFDLNNKTAQNVFGKCNLIEVVRMKQFELIIELMVCPEEKAGGMSHLALEYWKAESVIEKAKEKGYTVIEFQKDNDRTGRYIKDKAGNIFEIKDINFG